MIRDAGGADTDGPQPAFDQVPASYQPCFGCHRREVADYLGHGMASTVGPVGEGPPTGTVENPRNGLTYQLERREGASWLTARRGDGGERRQRLVGRIGSGRFDVSWVGEEVDPSGGGTGRLFFAPVETLSEHGNELSPFELGEGAVGLDLALTRGCLVCHTDTPLASLPGASVAPAADGSPRLYPSNALGGDAFEHLRSPGCDACHGDPELHLAMVNRSDAVSLEGDSGLRRLVEEPAGAQRDVCARCHLQGDARIDLASEAGGLRSDRPLAAQVPVLVPAQPGDDFRFVSQLERLALSPCFEGTPSMTCTTCHRPHQGVEQQGTASFDAVCAACHQDSCNRPTDLAVATVTGEPARTQGACVDCHVRRSQPFDLPHVRSADHFVRRHIPRPQDDIPHRQFDDPSGDLVLYDDGRLAEVLATPAGKRWLDGVEAMAWLSLGRPQAASEGFEGFPPPGSTQTRAPSAPEPLVPLETLVSFHQTRGLVFLATGRPAEARLAWQETLALDPSKVGTRLDLARLQLDLGDVRGALVGTQAVIDAYPRAEQPWGLRATLAERVGRFDLALEAFEASTRIWPSNAVSWFKLGLLQRAVGREAEARQSLDRARALEPSLVLPGAGPLAEH